MKLKTASLLAALGLALIVPASAAAALEPPSFTGISPQTAGTESDYTLMELAGVRSVRLPMFWSAVQPESRFVSGPDFEGFDGEVRLAAEHGIKAFPFFWGTPEWVAPEAIDLPVASLWQRWAWTSFLRDAVRRYGPQGSFWEENPDLPFLPIRKWEIWNEENLVTFARPVSPRRYADLIRMSGRVLHREDPGAQVIFGGLTGHPLQEPPNVSPGGFLSGVYRARSVKGSFDGVALHPYVADVSAIQVGPQPAAGDARPPRRRRAHLHHRDGLGLQQPPVALGAGAFGPGAGTEPRQWRCSWRIAVPGGSAASGGSPG